MPKEQIKARKEGSQAEPEPGGEEPPQATVEPTTKVEGQSWLLASLGLVILLFGLACGLYLSWRVLTAEIVGFFSLPIIDFVPFQGFDNLDCPALLTRNETGTIITTIKNPSDKTIEYSVRIAARQITQAEYLDTPVIVSSPERTRVAKSLFFGNTLGTSGTLPANGVVDVIWKVRVPDRQGDAVSVNVSVGIGNSSSMGSCGIVLTNVPALTGRQIVSLILLSIPLGGLLWLYGRMPLSRLGCVGIIISILLWVIIKSTLT